MKSNMAIPLISISVPVYNVEKYLRQCLDSLLSQTLRDIEVVIVDDGSTDGSGKICDEYAAKDKRILLIHKDNGGLASARQAALEASTGEFFCACDADDWVEPTMYERLYNKAQETGADMVSCNCFFNYSNGTEVLHECDYKGRGEDMLNDVLCGKFPHMIWNKIIRKELFDKHKISWEKGINMGEDFLLTVKLFQSPVTYAHVNDALYHYRRVMDGSSYTNDISMSSFNQSLAIRKWMMQNLETARYGYGMFRMWIALGFTGLRVREGMAASYFNREVLSNLPLSDFLRYHSTDMKSLLVFTTKVFGYDTGRWLCSKLYRFFYK